LKVLGREAALLRWLALLAPGGVPAHIEELRPSLWRQNTDIA
jgi:hypothetical protein